MSIYPQQSVFESTRPVERSAIERIVKGQIGAFRPQQRYPLMDISITRHRLPYMGMAYPYMATRLPYVEMFPYVEVSDNLR